MAQPAVYTWNNTFVDMLAPQATAQTLVLNQPIRLSEFADLSYSSPADRITAKNPNLRYSNVQPISVKVTFTAGSTPLVQLTITGLNAYNQVQVEDLSVPKSAVAAKTKGFFRSIISVVPTSFGTATTLSITDLIPGLSNGDSPPIYNYTIPFICDIWNKQALYSCSIESSAEISIVPQYSLSLIPRWTKTGLSGQQPALTSPLWFNAGSGQLTITATLIGIATLTTSPTFLVTGVNSTGGPLSEVLTFPSGSTSGTTSKSYTYITSVSLTQAAVSSDTSDVRVSATSNGASVSASTPSITGTPVPRNILNNFPFFLPVIGGTSSFNFPNYPITAIRFYVLSVNSSSFTATILQQGGYY